MISVIWLQGPEVFWLVGETISSSLSVYMGLVVLRREEIHTAKLLVPERSAFEFDTATEKLKIHKFQIFIKSQQN
jgi:hypothetical protein